jgi:hypothetical protein
MRIVENVFEIAKSFVNDAKYVKINDFAIDALWKSMEVRGKAEFKPPFEENVFKGIILELVASSVNYCYWYGRSNIRPNGANSSLMYDLLLKSFSGFQHASNERFKSCIEDFKIALAINRFPLLEERIRHLDQLTKNSNGIKYGIIVENTFNNMNLTGYTFEELFESLLIFFPGFASDIFLKRASLFFIELYRRFGWLEDDLHGLFVPADYQIPKILEHFKCIEYHPSLKLMIHDHNIIPKNSIQECEIRAATIITMDKLSKLTGWNIADVDSFLFTRRHEVSDPFHLTITTDY